MGYSIVMIMSFSILPAAFAGLINLRHVETDYHPILFLLLLGVVNEILSSVLIFNGYSNAVNTNIFLLLEVLLILWQFRNWGLYDEYLYLFRYIAIALVLGWFMMFWKSGNIFRFLPLFRYVASGVIVIMSMLMIIKLTITYNGKLLRSSMFLFCTSFCIYFSTAVLVEVFLQMKAEISGEFKDAVFKSGSIVNVICNLIYFTAVLWMPKKPRSIMQ